MTKQKNNSLYLAELMMDVMPKVVQSIREEMRQGRGDHLTVAQFRVLAAISRGLCHNKSIGDVLGVSEAAVSRMIEMLVQEGWVKKGTSKIDKRQCVLSLTGEGQTFFNSIKKAALKRMQNKLSGLSIQEQSVVIQGLEVLQLNLSLLNK